MPKTLSVVLITLNEAANLPRTLQSVEWAQEIVVVDSGSTDATVEIARAAGARVYQEPWKGFAAQKNSAIAKATGEWVLSLDADEEVSPELAREMIVKLANILRALLKDHDTYVPLSEELSFTDDYLDIEVVRFGADKLKVEKEIDPRTLGVLVPSILLQPLIENSIKHGLEPRLHGGTVIRIQGPDSPDSRRCNRRPIGVPRGCGLRRKWLEKSNENGPIWIMIRRCGGAHQWMWAASSSARFSFFSSSR